MLNYILKLDTSMTLYLNQWHNPFLDWFMDFISHSLAPVIFIFLLILWLCFYKFKRFGFIYLFFILLNFALTDSISSRIFKPYFKRYRPCHEAKIARFVRAYPKCAAGKYGFVSSHGANTMGLALILLMIFYKKIKLIALFIPYSVLVSYSRIYLGKHYLLDILGGWLLAALTSFFVYFLLKKSLRKLMTTRTTI